MFIPGRIEFLGKHTDYCGGRSIVCAIDRGFHLEVEPLHKRAVELFNEDARSGVSISLDDPASSSGAKWILYPRTVVERVVENFRSRPLQGLRISFRSTLPGASGLSSSSALVTAVFLAIDEVNGLRDFQEFRENIPDEASLAEYLGCVENGQTYKALAGGKGVGTFGGSQDHAAILCSKRDRLSLFSYCPVRLEAEFGLPESVTFVVASSGVKAAKTGDAKEKFNRVSQMVSAIVGAWPGEEATLAQMIERHGIDAVERFAREESPGFDPNELTERVRQFYAETNIIEQVAGHLRTGRLDMIGGLIDISQRNAERYLRNQTEETVHLQRSAREMGALAASAFGAGFGGSVYALVDKDRAAEFTDKWRRGFTSRFPDLARYSSFFTATTSQIA